MAADAGIEDPHLKRNQLITEYQDYVQRVVGTMVQSMGLPSQLFSEFVSAGYLGLVEAASRFDFGIGKDFKTFAFLRIRGAVIDSIRECADTSGKAYQHVKALQAAHQLREESGEIDGLAQGKRTETLAEVFDFASKGVLAFRLSIGDAEQEVADEIGSSPTPEQVLSRKQKFKRLRAAIATLPAKERLLIEDFYFKDRSFAEIANGMEGISKSWISRLHSKALAKLAAALREDDAA